MSAQAQMFGLYPEGPTLKSYANQFSAESKDPVPEWLQMPADKAAQKMLSAVRQNRDEEVIAAHAKLAVQAERHLPKLVSLITRSDKLVKSLSKDAE